MDSRKRKRRGVKSEGCGKAVRGRCSLTACVAGAAFFLAHDSGRLAELWLGG